MRDIWYNNLNKSPLTPPSYVFGIVWPILYLMIGLSFYTNKKFCINCEETALFGAQLFFNLIWTTIFFRLKMLKTAIGVLFLIIYFTMKYMSLSNSTSRLLLTPYLLWLFFALYLNLYIVTNN